MKSRLMTMRPLWWSLIRLPFLRRRHFHHCRYCHIRHLQKADYCCCYDVLHHDHHDHDGRNDCYDCQTLKMKQIEMKPKTSKKSVDGYCDGCDDCEHRLRYCRLNPVHHLPDDEYSYSVYKSTKKKHFKSRKDYWQRNKESSFTLYRFIVVT